MRVVEEGGFEILARSSEHLVLIGFLTGHGLWVLGSVLYIVSVHIYIATAASATSNGGF